MNVRSFHGWLPRGSRETFAGGIENCVGFPAQSRLRLKFRLIVRWKSTRSESRDYNGAISIGQGATTQSPSSTKRIHRREK